MLYHFFKQTADWDEEAVKRSHALRQRMCPRSDRLLNEKARLTGLDMNTLSSQVNAMNAREESNLERRLEETREISVQREQLKAHEEDEYYRRRLQQIVYAAELKDQVKEKYNRDQTTPLMDDGHDGAASMRHLGQSGLLLEKRTRELNCQQKQWIKEELEKRSLSKKESTSTDLPPAVPYTGSLNRSQKAKECAASNIELVKSKQVKKVEKLECSEASFPSGRPHTLRTDFRGLPRDIVKSSLISDNKSILQNKEEERAIQKRRDDLFAKQQQELARAECHEIKTKQEDRIQREKEALKQSQVLASQVKDEIKQQESEDQLIDSKYNDEFFSKRFGNSLT